MVPLGHLVRRPWIGDVHRAALDGRCAQDVNDDEVRHIPTLTTPI